MENLMDADNYLSKAQAEKLILTIEDLKRVQAILKISRNKLSTVFDSITDPIVSLSPDLTIESVNKAAADLAGMHPRDLAGMPGRELTRMSPIIRRVGPTCLKMFRKMMAEGKPQSELFESTAHQDFLAMKIDATPIFDDDRKFRLGIIYTRDVTALKRMEREIRLYSESLEERVAQRTSELTLANAELQRLDQLRSDLTAMVVHDMKSPLAEVMGNLELLSLTKIDDYQSEILDMASSGGDGLLRMIMNLLDIDRLEEGRLQVKQEKIIFSELAGKVVDRFRTMVRLKELRVRVSDDLPQGFTGDPDLLTRVLQNLFTNAFHHTPEQGNIRLSASKGEQGGALITVADDGQGIPKHLHHRIFRKFTQASNSSGPRTSTGLGLTFCEMAAKAHGGKIWFDSASDQGASFYVWLPGDQ